MSDLLYQETGGVAVITLNRAAVKNAVNGNIMDGLREHVAVLGDRTDIHAVILTGAGDESFCAGGDLRWLQRYYDGIKGEQMSRRMQGIVMALSALPMPVIGVLNGYALGGGAELALACDLRVMEAHSFMCFKQVQVGIMTGWTGGARLLSLVGYARALEFLTTCEKIHPDRALELGLTNAVVASGNGLDEAHNMAERIGRGAPRSVRAMKTLLQASLELDVPGSAEVEARLFRTIWGSADHQEALEAFFEKRKPHFKGHSSS